MRSEGSLEGALLARIQPNQRGKGKKNSYSLDTSGGTKYDFPPCKHYGRKGHPPLKCWRRLDQRCEKF